MLSKVGKKVGEVIAVIGFIDRKNDKLFNSAAIIYNGKIYGIYHKFLLPNYSVFDERRYFTPGKNPLTFSFDNICFGVNICEDIWQKTGRKRGFFYNKYHWLSILLQKMERKRENG